MAELQWVIEARCVNTLLADFKVGERGQHICVHVPNRDLDPHEFGKLIEGAEEAGRIAREHLNARQHLATPRDPIPIEAEVGSVSEIEVRHDRYEIRYLKSGEVVSVNIPGAVLGSSELDQLIRELKTVQSHLANS